MVKPSENSPLPNDSGWLRERFAKFAEQVCLISASQTYSYRELNHWISDFRDRLKNASVAEGATVALIGDFGIETLGAMFALIEHKAIIIPIVSSLSELEIKDRIREAAADWQCDAKRGFAIEKIATPDSSHQLVVGLQQTSKAGLILFSSGSVGKPKAMIHDLSNLLNRYYSRKPRQLRILSFLLFDHIGGLNTLLSTFASGSTLVIPGSHQPETVAKSIESHKVHILPTSPTFLNLLLMSGAPQTYDLSSLKIITYGTEPMPDGLLLRLRKEFPKTKLLQTFGTSETGISTTSSKSSSSTLMRIDDPSVEYKIVEGELWLKSQTQILGYLNHDHVRFTADGWFKTGDVVVESDDGYLKIVGRREELINVGGEKVTPIEVEGVLMELDEIQDCRVFAAPNSITGQSVSAEVVSGIDDLSDLKRLIRKHCRLKLQPYKVPTKISIVEATKFSHRFKKQRSGV